MGVGCSAIACGAFIKSNEMIGLDRHAAAERLDIDRLPYAFRRTASPPLDPAGSWSQFASEQPLPRY